MVASEFGRLENGACGLGATIPQASAPCRVLHDLNIKNLRTGTVRRALGLRHDFFCGSKSVQLPCATSAAMP